MPALDPSWTPDEDAATLLNERTWLIGAILTGVGYGIVFTLTVMCIGRLVEGLRSRRSGGKRLKLISLVYVILVFIFATLFIAGSSTMAQYSFIDYRNYPGGPAQFETDEFAIPVSEMGNVAFVLSNWFADIVVVWRCLVVYKGCRLPWWAVYAIPCLVYLASWTLGLLWLIQVSASSPWESSTINFTQPYFWTSFSLNVSMTIAIVGRLLLYRHRINKVMGRNYGRQYTSIASMIIESSILYTGFQLLFIVPFGLNSAAQTLFLQPLSQVQIIAPLLIIFRVSSGRAWTTDTSTQIFKPKREPSNSVELSTGRTQVSHRMAFAKPEDLSTDESLTQTSFLVR